MHLTEWGHVLVAESDYLNLTARVELFSGQEKQPISYIVKLGRNPSQLDYSEAYADFFRYFPKEQRRAFDGSVSPLPVMTAPPRLTIPILSTRSNGARHY
jgi:hypothetical protein